MSTIMTVTGPIPADEMGFTLVHEHLFLDLNIDGVDPNLVLNDPEAAYAELMRFKEAGGHTVIDQTTGGSKGRQHLPELHPLMVRQLSEKTGLNIVLEAGWYKEPSNEKRLYRMTVDEIAKELVRDIAEGLEGTTVRAGVLGEIGARGGERLPRRGPRPP